MLYSHVASLGCFPDNLQGCWLREGHKKSRLNVADFCILTCSSSGTRVGKIQGCCGCVEMVLVVCFRIISVIQLQNLTV